MIRTLLWTVAVAAAALAASGGEPTPAPRRPNVLWISCEDISPNLGCYGDARAHTPVLDRLAAEGVRYTNVFSTAGVCAPTRSAIITGVIASTLGSHHMRCQTTLPEEVKCFPEYLRRSGYYCTNNAKTDYNFAVPKAAWDECSRKAHWRNRPAGAPFFAVFNLTVTHESQIRATDAEHARNTQRLTPDQRQDPDGLTPPPFHPNTPVVRRDWARYYEIITAMDYQAGDLLEQLREDGLEYDTIVFLWSDHGAGLPRMKRWLYDSGTHVPMIARIPEKFRAAGQGVPGSVDDQLVSFLDLAPTVLNLAGVAIPSVMQGRAFLGRDLSPPREYVFGARDRMDERYDLIRAVHDKRYRYVRNYEPWKTYAQDLDYMEQMPTMKEMRRLAAEGKLAGPERLFFQKTKPVEELYDLENDPHEIRNLAGEPKMRPVLERLRAAHQRWMLETRDLGLVPEAEMDRWREQFGPPYGMLRQPGAEELLARLREVVEAGERGAEALPALTAAMDDPDASVRFWAATGLGNLGAAAKPAEKRLTAALEDDSPIVRVASARALWRLGQTQAALPALVRQLGDAEPAVRLASVLVLDEMGEIARPALDALQRAVGDKQSKYVARVATHSIAQLQLGATP